MSVAEVKNKLHQLVVETDNAAILHEVESYFEELLQHPDWWETMSDREKAMLEKGLKQSENGDGIPSEVVQATAKRMF